MTTTQELPNYGEMIAAAKADRAAAIQASDRLYAEWNRLVWAEAPEAVILEAQVAYQAVEAEVIILDRNLRAFEYAAGGPKI